MIRSKGFESMQELHDRINRVINTHAFETALAEEGVDLFEFQCEWPQYQRFDDLPAAYRHAICKAEWAGADCAEVDLV